jgi:hypothetical protein
MIFPIMDPKRILTPKEKAERAKERDRLKTRERENGVLASAVHILKKRKRKQLSSWENKCRSYKKEKRIRS